MHALDAAAPRFRITLDAATLSGLTEYFRALTAWNPRLHLVAPCTPAEFATRHVLESLLATQHMKPGDTFIDVGSGGGLPALPCLVARPDLGAVLVESSQKKAVFLREALRSVGASDRAQVVAERFETLAPPQADALTCRALERFTQTLPALVAWAANVKTLLLFGGPAVREQLESLGARFEALHIPDSEQRYLFVVRRHK